MKLRLFRRKNYIPGFCCYGGELSIYIDNDNYLGDNCTNFLKEDIS